MGKKSKSAQTQKASQQVLSKLANFTLYSTDTKTQLKTEQKQKKEKQTAKQMIHWLDLYNFKQYKKNIDSQIEKRLKKENQTENQKHIDLIHNKIQKLYFYLQTYSQQFFDMYFKSDTLTKYNFDLLHFDLLLKSENLNNQLLYYRLTDTKKRTPDFSTYIMDTDYVKWVVYEKTEKSIIEKLTNDIILKEIAKNDSLKLEFLSIYYKNLSKKDTLTRKTISNYKKYIVDKYSYLFSE